MSEKLIVHKVPDEVQKQNIETLKVCEETYMLILFLELRGKKCLVTKHYLHI